ncbi:MAG: magnesium-translocating P-type ATPase [Erysipelotrichaceae bacterium]|nr:magnesium-translocating P-type ATPase [Erysipelotrichaceae bacterium]
MKKNQKNKFDTLNRLRTLAFLAPDELYASLITFNGGLTSEEADNRLADHGKNIITTGNRITTFSRLKESVISPFNTILVIIAIITYFTDVVYADSPDYVTVVIIISLVTVSSLVAFIQSRRSDKAAESLSKMISSNADVWRDGKLTSIPMEAVVPGDIVKLSAGDMIPADIRFLTTKDTFVAQSALTGESAPVEKFGEIKNSADEDLTDLANLGFMGTNIISGSSTAMVLTTGNNTYFGLMARSLTGDRAKTSFERGVDSVSSLLVRMMFLLIPIVFLINGVAKGDWLDALLFSISIAVGLTPEMLPVIMTSTLARGAVNMSKHQVIIRTLGAIQTFGEMDVLCTDKTGTLTEDKIILERYLNLRGENDDSVLGYAYLNSYYQTGLKNLIDLAVINRAIERGMEYKLAEYTRVDEIPFDFARRRMSVVLNDQQGHRQLITKGAVEELMSIAAYFNLDGKIVPITADLKKLAMDVYEKHNADGLRMIAVAYKNNVPASGELTVADENEMILTGFIGFLDPPKGSAKAAIDALRDHGVRTVVLTGDSEGVARLVCSKVGVNTVKILTGTEVEKLDNSQLLQEASQVDVFAKLSPAQKERVVKLLQVAGHTVGYMGDGINDSLALRQADVGISVDSAVDIAKESADIILLKKDLMVLEEGVIEGRRTFGNINKYIKMAASGNFGNMISVMAASIFLPFLPMLPVQILTQNLLCDFAQMGIPFDRVDKEYLLKPHKWDTGAIKSFMLVLGTTSSIFDILCFVVLWWGLKANTIALAPLFHCGWFVFGTVSQIIVIHAIRTTKIPFIQSTPAKPLLLSTLAIVILTFVIGFSDLSVGFYMTHLPLSYIPWLLILLLAYFVGVQLIKKIYVRHYGEWM